MKRRLLVAAVAGLALAGWLFWWLFSFHRAPVTCDAARSVVIDVAAEEREHAEVAMKERQLIPLRAMVEGAAASVDECSRGVGEACGRLADTLPRLRHWKPKALLPALETCAEETLSSGCYRGSGPDCALLADWYDRHPPRGFLDSLSYVRPSSEWFRARERRLVARACEEGDGSSCLDRAANESSLRDEERERLVARGCSLAAADPRCLPREEELVDADDEPVVADDDETGDPGYNPYGSAH